LDDLLRESNRVRRSQVREFLQRYGLLISFLLLCLVLSLLSDRFLTVGNLTNVLRQSTINLIIAVGMTYVILTAGIDLSVGAVLALSTVVTADIPTVLLGLTLGGVLGMASGLLISRVKVPPFVATLGMMTVARGLALTYTQGRPITGMPDAFRFIGTGYLGPIPMPIIVAGVTFLAGYLLLTRTRMGMNIYALGNNPVAAHYTGIATNNYITFVYVLAGSLAALAGMILVARLDSAQPTAGISFEFDAIAAVVVGGTSFAGGEGSLLGTLLGVLVISVLSNGLNLLNVSSFYQPVVTGVVIALALLLYKAVR
jgi:ribose/xylose/arabinose/galactoside ABC-type transport system permease subunit